MTIGKKEVFWVSTQKGGLPPFPSKETPVNII